MPVILIPVLWVGGAIVLLGGGWYVIGHMVHYSGRAEAVDKEAAIGKMAAFFFFARQKSTHAHFEQLTSLTTRLSENFG